MGTSADYRLSAKTQLEISSHRQRVLQARREAPARGYMDMPCPDFGNSTVAEEEGHWKCDTCGEEGDN